MACVGRWRDDGVVVWWVGGVGGVSVVSGGCDVIGKFKNLRVEFVCVLCVVLDKDVAELNACLL